MLKRRRALTQENFDLLLAWLDCERERAAVKYESIRVSLIKILMWRGSNDAEDLADETINRVAEKVHLLKDTFVGDPAIYFYAVAKRLLKEEQRNAKSQVPISESYNLLGFPREIDEPTDNIVYECLHCCLQSEGAERRDMILSYYVGERNVKIANRKAMAERLGIPLNSLRVRMYRIREGLEACIENCINAQLNKLSAKRQ